MQALDEVVRKYPNTEYAIAAKKKIEIARDQLAGKEMETARYYQKRRDYIAAINRFKVVITQYQTTRHVEEALMRLTETYMSLGIVNEAQTAAAVLGHNFPDSPWYKDAYRLVKWRRARAARGPGLLDQQGLQEGRAGLGRRSLRRASDNMVVMPAKARHPVSAARRIANAAFTGHPRFADDDDWSPCSPASPSATSS